MESMGKAKGKCSIPPMLIFGAYGPGAMAWKTD